MLSWVSPPRWFGAAALGAAIVAQLSISSPIAIDRTRPTGRDARALTWHAHRNEARNAAGETTPNEVALLGTLFQTHTKERVLVSSEEPSPERWNALLADRVTGSETSMHPRLLELLRTLFANHPGAHIELVSGYRSEKLNEMMRKKGHHVASHSEHSLGHAVDFRIVLPGETRGMNPRDVEREVRALGWDGGVGTYFGAHDWFVHADVGKNRRWNG